MSARPLAYLPILAIAALSSACAIDLEARVVSASGQFDRQLTVDGPPDIEVRTGSGSIDIRTGGSGQVRVVGRITAHRGFWNSSNAEERVRRIEANPPVTQNGNSIRIGEFAERNLFENVSISYEI